MLSIEHYVDKTTDELLIPDLIDEGSLAAYCIMDDMKYSFTVESKLSVVASEPLCYKFQGVEHMIPSFFPEELVKAIEQGDKSKFIKEGRHQFRIDSSIKDQYGEVVYTNTQLIDGNIHKENNRLQQMLVKSCNHIYDSMMKGLIIIDFKCQKNLQFATSPEAVLQYVDGDTLPICHLKAEDKNGVVLKANYMAYRKDSSDSSKPECSFVASFRILDSDGKTLKSSVHESFLRPSEIGKEGLKTELLEFGKCLYNEIKFERGVYHEI